jgi:predicted aconitase
MRDNLSITPELRRELQDRRDRIARGEMSQKERKSQMRKAALDEFQFYLPHLRYSEIKQVFHAATPEEKEIIRPIMLKKAVQIMRSNPFEGQREGALDAFNEK